MSQTAWTTLNIRYLLWLCSFSVLTVFIMTQQDDLLFITVNSFLSLTGLTVPVWIWWHYSLMPGLCFHGCLFIFTPLKVIVFSTRHTTDWHLESRSLSLRANPSPAYQGEATCVYRRGPTAGRGPSPFSSVVSGSRRQIPVCLSVQSAGQTRSQPSGLKQSSNNHWRESRWSVCF